MKSNINMTNGVVKSGEFSYVRQPRTLKAYGQEYPIPVRTVEFSEALESATKAIAATKNTSETVAAIRVGIAAFIGNEETERIFPAEKLGEIDVDEILAFWYALNGELKRSQETLLAKYAPAPVIRK